MSALAISPVYVYPGGSSPNVSITATYSDGSTAAVPEGSVDWSMVGSSASVSAGGLVTATPSTSGTSSMTATLPDGLQRHDFCFKFRFPPSEIFVTANSYTGNFGGFTMPTLPAS